MWVSPCPHPPPHRCPVLVHDLSKFGFSMSFFTGILFLPITTATCVICTYPLIVLALTAITEPPGNRPGQTALILHIVAFAGLMLALLGPAAVGEDEAGDPGDSVSPQLIGYLLVGLSALSLSAQALCCNRLLKLDVAPIKSAAIVNLIQPCLLGPWYGAAVAISPNGIYKWAMPTSDMGTAYAWVSIVAYTASQLTLFVAFSTATDPSKVAYLQQTDPIVAIILAGALLGEIFFWYQWIGVGIMVMSLSIASILQRRENDNAVYLF